RIPAAEHGVFPPRFPALFRRKYSYVEGSGAADEHFFNKLLKGTLSRRFNSLLLSFRREREGRLLQWK
ncbi:MAG: hypothetical protein ACM3S5_11200, partial [Rhodospirillales bacterium]